MNASQRYKLIFWHILLKDVKKHHLETFVKYRLPGYEIDWAYMATEIDKAANSSYKRRKVAPFVIHTKRQFAIKPCCEKTFVMFHNGKKYVGKYI